MALIVLSRLPYVSEGTAVLDGDEAILALMSKHLSEGQPLELFFYGQNFGVTLVENVNAALFFMLLGVSTTTLKIATLSLWIMGWSFFLFGTRRLTDTNTALIASLLLLTCSAWILWSTLARGYHVGGFMLFQLCFWQFASLYKSDSLSKVDSGRFVWLGLSVGLLFLTQKLWFISFLPFLAMVLWRRKSLQETLIVTVCLIAVATLPQFFPGTSSQYWNPEYLREMNPILAATALPERIWTFFSGVYSYSTRIDSNVFAKAAATAWCLALIISGAILGKQLRTGPERSLSAAIIASGLLVMGATLFISTPLFGYRYLLPIASLCCLSLALCIPNRPEHAENTGSIPTIVATTTIVLTLSALGILATGSSKNFRAPTAFNPTTISPQESIDQLIRDLEAQGIHHVYSLDPMLQWNIIFSSQESITARWSDPKDRRPEYPLRVDQALFAGESTAIVGTAELMESFTAFLGSRNIQALPIYAAGDRYFWLLNPSQELLQAVGFELNPDSIKTSPH